MIFLDTNIFLRALLVDHPQFSPRCKELLKQVESGEIEAVTTDLTVAEVVFMLEAPSQANWPKHKVTQLILPIVLLTQLATPAKQYWKEIFKIYMEKNVDFTDAYNMALMRARGVEKVYSYDHDFDKVGYVKRLEP